MIVYLNIISENEWQISHDYSKFKKAVEALKSLPSSQAHGVRDDLFAQLRETQESEWQFLLSSYSGLNDAWKCVQEDLKLYTEINADEYSTVFLDALEMKKFLDDKGNQVK